MSAGRRKWKNDFLGEKPEGWTELEKEILEVLELLRRRFKGDRSHRTYLDLKLVKEEIEKSIVHDDLKVILEKIVEYSFDSHSPKSMAHMDSIPTLSSVLGSFLAAVLNNNMLSRELAPALYAIEEHLIGEMTQLFGLDSKSGGMFLSGGSLCNLQALAVARNAMLSSKGDLFSATKRPIIFTSADAHTSLEKAAMILGLGEAGVRRVPVTKKGIIDMEALAQEVEASKKRDEEPFALVGTAGTTVRGCLDPLEDLGKFAKSKGLWFHIDAAYAGSMVFSDRWGPELKGIEKADSLTFNPQKWAYVTKTCAMVLFQDFEKVKEVFRTGLPYMHSEDAHPNYGEISIQGTRHPDALKFFLTKKLLGKEGLGELIDETMGAAAQLSEALKELPRVRVLGEPQTSLVCARIDGFSDQDYENLQKELLEMGIYVSIPRHEKKRLLRFVVLNPFTDTQTIHEIIKALSSLLGEKRKGELDRSSDRSLEEGISS